MSGNAIHAGDKAGISIGGPETFGRITGNAIWANEGSGVAVYKGGLPTLTGNFLCGNASGFYFDTAGADEVLVGAGNVFSRNDEGDVVVKVGDAPPAAPREAGYYDRALCAGCGAAGAALKQCKGCMRFAKVFSPRYCGPECQKAHWKAHKPECQRAEERADEWVHAMDALLDLPGCPYGDLKLLAQRRRQRALEAAEPEPDPEVPAGP